jgi:prepilin-type N-terminal cleavage/methylation domain-containing protein
MKFAELKPKQNFNQGFTLVELVITVVVLTILVGIAVPLYSHVTRTAADRTHNANVRQIKGAVQMASFKYAPPSSSTSGRHKLWGEATRNSTDSESVNWPEGGWGYYLQDWPEVPRQSRAYGNDLQTQGTEYVVYIEPGGLVTIHPPPLDGVTETAGSEDPAFRLSYDFTDPNSFQGFCELVVSSNCNAWSFEDAFYFNHSSPNGTIFMPNNLNEYTVTVRGSLSAGTIGGFGIFFDTTAEPNGANDNGFIFQFDRGVGEGQFIVRPRVDGVEGNRVASFASSNLDGIPTKEEDPQWWSSPHDVSVKVSNAGGANQRKGEFYIDGIFIGSYSYEKELNENEQYYSGLRGWHAKSKYYSFELE